MFERKEPLISIIVPSWFNSEQHGKYGRHETFWFAAECLLRLLEVTQRELVDRDKYELIIIDNGSTIQNDDVNESDLIFPMGVGEYWLAADVLIRNKQNLGFGPACNQGFAIARGEYVCCLNNDILLWQGWEDALMEMWNLTLPTPIGVAMPALMRETNDAKKALIMKKEEIDLKRNADKFGVGAEFGSLWFCRNWLLKEIVKKDGFVFDEKFRCGFSEDRDLWDRVRKMGFETYRTHRTRVYHQGNMSIGKIKDRKLFTEANRAYLQTKREERNKLCPS